MIRTRATCRAPAAGDTCRCDRPRGHDGEHAWTDDEGHAYRWGRPSGPSRPHAARQGAGLTRCEVYLSREAATALDALSERLGSNRAAIEWALVEAGLPPPTIGTRRTRDDLKGLPDPR